MNSSSNDGFEPRSFFARGAVAFLVRIKSEVLDLVGIPTRYVISVRHRSAHLYGGPKPTGTRRVRILKTIRI